MDGIRREPRKKLKIPVRITLYGEGAREVLVQIECHTKNISMNGLGIEMQIRSADLWEKLNNFTPDSQNTFFIGLNIINPEKEIRLSGTVMWSKVTDFENKELQIGISLQGLDDETLKEWSGIVEDSQAFPLAEDESRAQGRLRTLCSLDLLHCISCCHLAFFA